jgi:hexosaminidase
MSMPALTPAVLQLTPHAGEFALTAGATIAAHGPGAREVAELLAEYLRPATGFPLSVTEEGGAAISLTAAKAGTDEFADEAYTLTVSPSGVQLAAPYAAGLARGIQTLRQLLPPAVLSATRQPGPWRLPALTIADQPRFRWRGMHLDVARHFFSVEQVCRFIDLLALHRFNRLHLHLTDDQGWRVEIKRYPRLTEVASRRPATLIGHEGARPRRYDGQPYGGFYTQDEVRRLVAYAARRHIVVVPEIDLPGHMQAAIAAYPELGNLAMPLQPRCHWGISQHILNVEPATIASMQGVYEELLELFPSRFIHVGGDEAVKHEWAESAAVQRRMAELGCRDEHELQSWFIRQMSDFLTSRGRRLLGWDEILEGGLAAGATVMSWRGEQGGIAAALAGHDVVMAPCQHVYFDHYQAEPTGEEPLAIGGLSTTAHVYAWEPVPAALSADRHHHVLGGQGQLWTEYIGSQEYLDYMAFPRACALAEVLWLPREQKCYRDFLARLPVHRQRLTALGVNAHPQP